MKQSPQTKRFRNFEILSALGKGGMGEVYLAQDLILGRKVAIKFLSGQIGKDEEFLKRFLQEAKASAILEHPNIVGVYSVGKAGDRPYIAMQYVQGKNLREILKGRGGPFSVPVAIHFAIQIAQALDCAHQKGIMHRDIKPDNIMVHGQNQIKVMDFGLAKSFQAGHSITQTGCYLGTPEYSSPEQCETLDIDSRSDLYSLGVVLYEMLSGQVPHRAETPLKLFRKIVEEKPTDIRNLNPEVPPSLSALLLRLLEKDRERRYSSASEVVRDLQQCLHSTRAGQQNLSKAPTISLNPLGTQETSGGNFVHQKEEEIEEAVTHISQKKLLTPKTRKKTLPLFGAVASILLLAGLFYFYLNNSKKPLISKALPNTPKKPLYQDPPRVGLLDFTNQGNEKDIAYLAVAISDILFSKLKSLKDVEVLSRDYFKKLIKKIDKKVGEEDNELRREKLSQKNLRFFIIGKFYRKKDKKVHLSLSIFDTQDAEGKMESFYREDSEEKIFDLIDELVAQTTRYLNGKIAPAALASAQGVLAAKRVPKRNFNTSRDKSANEGISSRASGLSKTKNLPLAKSPAAPPLQRDRRVILAMSFHQKLRNLSLSSPKEDNQKGGRKEDPDRGEKANSGDDKAKKALSNLKGSSGKEPKKPVAKRKARGKKRSLPFSPLTLEILKELRKEKPENIQSKCSFLLGRLLFQAKCDLQGGNRGEAQKNWTAFKELKNFRQLELRESLKKIQSEIEKELK